MPVAILLVVWAAIGCAYSPLVFSATTEIDGARINAVRWLVESQSGDGSWGSTEGRKIIETAEAVRALRNAGVLGYPYWKGISWLRNASARSNDALARQISALAEAGIDLFSLYSRLLTSDTNYYVFLYGDYLYNGWGVYEKTPPDFVDTALALGAANYLYTTYSQRIPIDSNAQLDIYMAMIFMVAWRNTDNGFPYELPLCSISFADIPVSCAVPASQVYATATAITNLQSYKSAGPATINQSFFDGSVTWLINQQREDGSFGGEAGDTTGTLLETIEAYRAIVTENGSGDLDAVDAENYFLPQQQSDGSWNQDAFLTALALQSLPQTTLTDTDNDGVPDEVEVINNTDPLVADSRYLASGSSQAIPGQTIPDSIFMVTMTDPVNATLADNGGPGPYIWQLVSGSLPQGITLDPVTGQLQGMPGEGGEFNFTYSVLDASGDIGIYVARIDVLAPDPAIRDGDITLDGLVDIRDVLLAQRVLSGNATLTSEQMLHGDVAPLINGLPAPNGEFNPGDVLVIRRKVMGLVVY